MAFFSSSDFAEPLSITIPSCDVMLTLWAVVESDLSETTAFRIFCTSSRSALRALPWSVVGWALRAGATRVKPHDAAAN